MNLINDSIEDSIVAYTKELRLPAIRKIFTTQAQHCAASKDSYEKFLLELLVAEYDRLIQNRRASAIRRAEFPYKKYLHELASENLPVDAAEKLSVLQRLDFIKNGQNVVLAGNPGTGKTHLAIGLGLEACLQGYKVFFTTVPRLITQIKEFRSEKSLRVLENRFEKYDLVICDEFGYISFDKEGAELLFGHLSLRAGRKSTIITTNLSFDKWEDIFGDPVLTAAMVDRLTHKAYLVNMNGNSYRIKETKEWIKNANNQNKSSNDKTNKVS